MPARTKRGIDVRVQIDFFFESFSIIKISFLLSFSRDIVQITDSILIGCFWAGMSSYVCLSLLKLYAVARPLAYRHNMTMVKCIYLIILSWIVFLFMTCYAFSVMALSKIRSLMDWSGCRFETCLRSYYRLRNYSLVTVYWITMIVFGLTGK